MPEQGEIGTRFAGKTRRAENGCLLWAGSTWEGYGRLKIGGKHLRAHRVAWELANGPIPPGLYVCHRCDNPSCVEPAHLFLGTQRDNVVDCIAKGRRNIEARSGEGHGRSRLTAAQVTEIRATPPGATLAIARRLGVSRKVVQQVRNRKAWKHLP